jgi:hypothetical protein
VSWASVRLVCLSQPDDPVERADWRTSQADLRTAICLDSGVALEDISPLGYDHSDNGYQRVRASWVRHIEQFGLGMFDRNPAQVLELWQGFRPDLAAGDDWAAEGAGLHRRRYPGGEGCMLRDCAACDPSLALELSPP